MTLFVSIRVGRNIPRARSASREAVARGVPAFVPGWSGKPTGQLRRSGAGGGECLLAMRRFDAIESRSDCRDSPVFVVARQRLPSH